MWQYTSLGSESAGPSTSSVHHGTTSPHTAAAAAAAAAAAGNPGNQPELQDMLQILDQSAAPNFDDLNMFNTNFEWNRFLIVPVPYWGESLIIIVIL